nr:hypothetical protein [Mycobacteroides abscessus]
MSGNERSTKQLIAVTDCRDLVRPAAAAQRLPSGDLDTSLVSGHERGRRAAAFASGGVLVVGAVAALHNLYRSGDDAAELIAWSGLLLLALTALGGGIKLAMWGARPVIAALFDRAKERLAEPVLAVVASGAVIVGALGMWWTFRGGYAGWWQQLSGESQWSLSLGVGQMLVAVLAGAALFTGGRYVTGLAREALTESGLLIERDRAAGRRRVPEGLWHPGLVAALVGGGLALVVMTAWLTPKVGPTIVGANTLAAVAAIVAVLVWGVGANLGWWKGLAGLWKWATDASHKAAATSGVVALLMFSAGGLGLGWFTPATVPQAHAQCPPDCGGGSNGSGSYGPDASQFQPPQMPGQMPDYQGGINQPPLDQNSSISIYNTQAPSVSNNGVQGSSGQQGPQQGWDQPAHGTQIPDYQNAAPYTQGPGRPNPDFNPGSDAGSQGGQSNQGAQQPVQQPQQASQQPPQQDAGQQPNQSPNQSSDQQKIDDLTRQLQDQQQLSSQDRQRIDDLTKQLQALNTAQAASTPDPNAGRLSSMPGVRDVSQPPLRPAPTLQPDQVDAFRAITRQNLENQNVPADQIEQRVNDAVKQAQTPRFMPDPQPMRTPGAQPLDRPLGDKFNDVMGRANDRAYDDIDGLGQLGKNLTGQGGPGAPGVAESWKDLGTNTVKGLPDAVGGGFVADGKRLYEEPGNFIGDKMVELPLAAVSVPLGGEGAAIERGVLGDLASTETKAVTRGPVETPPVQLPAVDVPKPRLADYFQPGSPPKASELEKYALSQGWKKSQTPSGPAKYSDNNGIVRMTIKEGSQRAPGSELPHVELRDPNGQRIDPFGNPVARKSPDNHTAIGWDW